VTVIWSSRSRPSRLSAVIPAELQLTDEGVSCVHVPGVTGEPASVTVNVPGANTTVTSLAFPSAATNDSVEPAIETADACAGGRSRRREQHFGHEQERTGKHDPR
jgi:hypothetical protein